MGSNTGSCRVRRARRTLVVLIQQRERGRADHDPTACQRNATVTGVSDRVAIEAKSKRENRSMREHDPQKPGVANGHSRRDFLRGSSVAAATAVLTGQATLALDEAQAAEGEPKILAGTVEITLKVNGQDRSCAVEPRSTLLDTLRHRLDVTGPKRVCDRASCGACTAIVDGDPVYSCTTLAVSCQGKTIETLESFDTGREGRAVRLPPE